MISQPAAYTPGAEVIRRLIVLVWKVSPRFCVALVAAAAFSSLLPLATIYLTSQLLGVLAMSLAQSADKESVYHSVFIILCGQGLVILLGQFFNRITETIQKLYQKRISIRVQELIAEKAASLDLAHFESPAFHNLLSNASNEAGGRPFLVLQQLINITSSSITVVSLTIVVCAWHFWLLPVVALAPLATSYLTARFATENARLVLERTETERKAHYLRSVLVSDWMAKEVRVFGLKHFFLGRLRALWEAIYAEEKQIAKRRLLQKGSLLSGLSLTQPLITGYAAVELIRGVISFSIFSLNTQSVWLLQSHLRGLASSVSQVHESLLYIRNLFSFLDITSVVETRQSTKSALPILGTPTVSFNNVFFQFPGTQAWVLENVSFTIKPGEIVALVGENGSGKTTAVKLLAGLYEPTTGSIDFDGIDTKAMGRHVIRQYLGVLFQDFVIYHLPLYENIGVGSIEKMHDRESVLSAAAQSGLAPIAESLADKYESILGRHYTRGHELSGGQRQLVALSRIALRSAPIFVMDEPTSALDINQEKRLYDQLFSNRTPKQSVLLVTHRLPIARYADRIVVLERGRVAEEGSHEFLVNNNGPYSVMYNKQEAVYGALLHPATRGETQIRCVTESAA